MTILIFKYWHALFQQPQKLMAYIPVVLTPIIGLGLSGVTTFKIAQREKVQHQQEFERQADRLAFVLQRNLDNASRVARSLGGLFEASEEITVEEFSTFSERILQESSSLLGVGFARRIPQSQRDRFEEDLTRRGIPHPFIWEGDRTETLEPSPEGDEYYPTTYIEPLEQREQLLGYNHYADWRRRVAIEQARDSNVTVTTSRVTLPSPNHRVSRGFIVYQPLYKQGVDNEENFLGVAYSVVQIDRAILASLQELDWQHLDFYLYDTDLDRLESALVKGLTAIERRFLLFYDARSQKTVEDPHLAQISRLFGKHENQRHCPYSQDWTMCIRTLNLQGLEWSVLILPNEKFSGFPRSAGMTFAIGLLVTASLTLYLLMSVKRETQNKRLIQALKEAKSDPLTGLANRREFERQLQLAVKECQTGESIHTLCCMDLDRFKIINDICGHAAGDRLLCAVSHLIQSKIRKTDLLARVGGDEFCLLLRHCSLEESHLAAEKILAAIGAFQFTSEQKTFKIGISLGLAEITATTRDPLELMRMADTACYRAKQNGRNCICVHCTHQGTTGDRGIEWLTWLNEGLADEFLQLYCQPTLSLKPELDRNYIEILLRLRDRSKMSLSPTEFIQDAERYQLMPTIDRWVLETFLHHFSFFVRETNLAENWQKNLYAINLSGATLNDEKFADFCREKLAYYQIPASAICFEITENVAIANIRKASQLILELKSLGCYFALDDFGSGMSSFAYLRDLPIDFLKVDGAFILNLAGDRITYSIVEAINRIGQVLGVQTIAEFVENDTLLEELKQLGFDYAQGFGIAIPTHLNDHFDLLGKNTDREIKK
ncbi:MAG: EAL domain-containing protein [Cyanobacteria bacterium SBLK]|nr:EAL domain-containing protein [Cyanobacteria bacterium SBLK]